MTEYKEILKLSENETVELASSFKEKIGKELFLGATRFMVRHGTLSDGHEKITPSQRYYQAIKEMYYLGTSIRTQKATAMEAQADLLDAQEMEEKAIKESEKLRAKAKVMMARERMVTSLVNIQDAMRQLDEFNNVRKELQKEVTEMYPGGAEEAELENWTAVMVYRSEKRKMGHVNENLTHIPMPQFNKTRLGIALGQPDLMAWEMAEKNKTYESVLLSNSNPEQRKQIEEQNKHPSSDDRLKIVQN